MYNHNHQLRIARPLAAWSLLLAAWCATPAAFAIDTGDIVVASTHGEVVITVRGAQVKLRAGSVLELPATLRTGRDGAVELRQGATLISVGPDTVLEFPALEKAGGPIDRVVQPRGNAFYSIGKRPGRKLRVETPFLVGVVKGTQFNVAAGEDATTISLFEGRLEILSTDGSDSVDLLAGQIASRDRQATDISVLKMDAPRPPAPPAPPAPAAPSGNSAPAQGAPGQSAPVMVGGNAKYAERDSVKPSPAGGASITDSGSVLTLDLDARNDTAGSGNNNAGGNGTGNVGLGVDLGLDDYRGNDNSGPGNNNAGNGNGNPSNGNVRVDLGVGVDLGNDNSGPGNNNAGGNGNPGSNNSGNGNVRVDLGVGVDLGNDNSGPGNNNAGGNGNPGSGNSGNANGNVGVDLGVGVGTGVDVGVGVGLGVGVDLGDDKGSDDDNTGRGNNNAGGNGNGNGNITVDLGVDLDVDLGLDDGGKDNSGPGNNNAGDNGNGTLVDTVENALNGLLNRSGKK
jgi:hypothetical protein